MIAGFIFPRTLTTEPLNSKFEIPNCKFDSFLFVFFAERILGPPSSVSRLSPCPPSPVFRLPSSVKIRLSQDLNLTRDFALSGKGAPVLDWKLLADAITLSRGLLGLILVWLGLGLGAAGLTSAVLVLLLCWISDFVDGRVARLNRESRHTWIGDRDVHVDAFVSLCLGLYMVAAGFVSGRVGVVYLLAWVLIFSIVGQNHGYLMLVQAPIYVYFLWVALRQAPQAGIWLLGLLAFVLLINWSHFIREVVPGFLKDMRNGAHPPRQS
jgi:phosphatidylglycerophosphate synthase